MEYAVVGIYVAWCVWWLTLWAFKNDTVSLENTVQQNETFVDWDKSLKGTQSEKRSKGYRKAAFNWVWDDFKGNFLKNLKPIGWTVIVGTLVFCGGLIALIILRWLQSGELPDNGYALVRDLGLSLIDKITFDVLYLLDRNADFAPLSNFDRWTFFAMAFSFVMAMSRLLSFLFDYARSLIFVLLFPKSTMHAARQIRGADRESDTLTDKDKRWIKRAVDYLNLTENVWERPIPQATPSRLSKLQDWVGTGTD